MLKILLVPVLLVVAAQLPSCGFGTIQSEPLVGFVDDKYIAGNEIGNPIPLIIIGATEYVVPWDFWRQVEVNDLVRFENGTWTIIRKAAR